MNYENKNSSSDDDIVIVSGDSGAGSVCIVIACFMCLAFGIIIFSPIIAGVDLAICRHNEWRCESSKIYYVWATPWFIYIAEHKPELPPNTYLTSLLRVLFVGIKIFTIFIVIFLLLISPFIIIIGIIVVILISISPLIIFAVSYIILDYYIFKF